MSLPMIGSAEYRQLDYKSQLEIVALKFFPTNEYNEHIGQSEIPPVNISLNIPPNPPLQPVDLPVAFVDRYWAGYVCAFRERWYPRDSSPLDMFDIDHRKCVNVMLFSFSFLVLSRPLHRLFSWINRFKGCKEFTLDTLMSACRMLLYIDHVIRDPDKSTVFKRYEESTDDEMIAREIYNNAVIEFSNLYDYDEINYYCPIIQTDSPNILFLEYNDYVVNPLARPYGDRWYYPLIPSKLYSANQFRIRNWDWLDHTNASH